MLPKPLLIQPAKPSICGSKVCLNMIVKNESSVIARVLTSVKDVIDYFVIVDTGSSDGTPQRIQQIMEAFGIPGEVHFRDWVNFGHNRQQALELAVAAGRGDWLLFIDADEELACRDPQWFQQLVPGVSYQLEKHHDAIRYALSNLIWVRGVSWHWHGVVHEYVSPDGEQSLQKLTDAWIIYHAGEGVRSRGLTQQQKFLRDAELLEAALRDNPDDARNRFYLAQSYRDAGEYRKAYKHYSKRAAMGGWVEEANIAQLEKASMMIRLGMGHRDIVNENLAAYTMRPTRAEALWQLASYCRGQQRYAEGYLFAKTGKDIPLPADVLFVRKEVYDWRLLDEFSICAYWIGQYQESADAGRRILAEGLYNPAERDRIVTNLNYALQKLAQ